MSAYATSPQEFLYLINHADLVCTDSFHGAVFSIIMNTNFITFSRKESGETMGSRMKHCYQHLGLRIGTIEELTVRTFFKN